MLLGLCTKYKSAKQKTFTFLLELIFYNPNLSIFLTFARCLNYW